MDINMPEMNGYETSKKIREFINEIKEQNMENKEI